MDAPVLILSGLAAAVGINMVFLYPYSLLARGWGREHRRLARFDLYAGMLVPYTLAASFRHADLSGMRWHVYRRDDPPVGESTPASVALP